MVKEKSFLLKSKIKNYYEGENFHSYLLNAFQERKSKNPRFSIRSFARLLEIDQSLLSKVLKGQRGLSPETTKKCLVILNADEESVNKMVEKSSKRIKFDKLNEDIFETISDWEYFAVLELFTLKDFNGTERNIALKLSLSPLRSKEVLERLLRLNLVSRDNGVYHLTSGNTSWAPTGNTTEAKKKLQRQLMEKSLNSLDEDPYDIRDHSSVTLAIKKSELPSFKKTLKDVRKQLTEMFQKPGDFDEVYQLNISLFPLTK